MDLPSFRALIERLARDIPPEFHDGVVAVEVRPATVPHPVHAGVYTLGECVPLEWSGNGADLRHHLEWRASVAALEDYDWAAEENFKRHEGEPFDPMFYRSGERVAGGVYKVDDDIFLEHDLSWHGRSWTVALGAIPRGAAAFA